MKRLLLLLPLTGCLPMMVPANRASTADDAPETAETSAPSSFASPSAGPAAPPTGPSRATPTPAGAPSSVSVTIRSRCSKTVRVFYGAKPKFGSGTTSSISSNSVQNKTFRPGDQMWIVDDRDNGLSSVQVSAATREIEVTASCSGLSSR
jgi:hypothetical protein